MARPPRIIPFGSGLDGDGSPYKRWGISFRSKEAAVEYRDRRDSLESVAPKLYDALRVMTRKLGPETPVSVINALSEAQELFEY